MGPSRVDDLDIKESQRTLFLIISDMYVKVCWCLFLCCFHVFVMIIGTIFNACQ
jgi:hypothetical protein